MPSKLLFMNNFFYDLKKNGLYDLDGSRFVMLIERRDSNYQNAKVLDKPPASAEANGNIMTS